jgi:TonB family protein
VVTDPAEAEKRAADFQAYIRSPVLLSVRARLDGFNGYDLEPPELPDLFAERPVVLTGKYRGAPAGRVVVTGRSAAGPFEKAIDVAQARVATGGALATLWARARIGRLTDLDGAGAPTHQAEITSLGLGYHLLTQHTSFVAVDHLVRGPGATGPTVQQPSPMPQGVDNSAVAASAEQAQRAGVLGVLKATSTPTLAAKPPSTDEALGSDANDPLGGLIGTHVGEAYGAGGLGLSGSGGGGGGTGEGTIGFGNVGTIGRAAGGTGAGYGRGAGGMHARGEEGRIGWRGAGDVTGGVAQVQGVLDKELIRRVIHRHLPELRAAYTRALATHPGLHGDVVVRFVIGPTGHVTTATLQSSTLGLPTLAAAIAQAVRGWIFPAPAGGGVVLVTYPFTFKP